MRTNLWQAFSATLPQRRRVIGTVTAHYPDGSAAFSLPSGESYLVRAPLDGATPPYRAFVVDGVIESRAPALTPVATEVG